MYFKRTLLSAAILLSTANITPAYADEFKSYEGTWRQVKSNAGECGKCSVTITRVGDVLRVVANNDWYANAIPVPKRRTAESPSAVGDGVWKNGGREKPLKIALIREKAELQVLLIVGDGERTQKIAAEFRKQVPEPRIGR